MNNTNNIELMKIKLAKVVFWICLVTSIALLVGSFFCPPMGIIDGSVLKAVGELFGFATLGMVPTIVKGRSVEFTHGNTTLTLGDDDDNNNDNNENNKRYG